jgi:hypothetical protein
MTELWVQSQPHATKSSEILNVMEGHHKLKIGWIHPGLCNYLSEISVAGTPLAGLPVLRISPHRLFPVGLFEIWGLPFANACNFEQPEWSNANISYKSLNSIIAKHLGKKPTSSSCVKKKINYLLKLRKISEKLLICARRLHFLIFFFLPIFSLQIK